tara:strand:- start:1738 stop:1851 length:114 start_codon:yes stop_codon:yes gene_type:complete
MSAGLTIASKEGILGKLTLSKEASGEKQRKIVIKKDE